MWEGKSFSINGDSIPGSPEKNLDMLYKNYQNIIVCNERENTLINHRLTWSVSFSGYMLAGQSFIAGATILSSNLGISSSLKAASCGLLLLLSIAALVIAITSSLSVHAAITQKDYIRDYYDGCLYDGKNLFETCLRLPRPMGIDSGHVSGNRAAKVIPIALIFLWSVAIIIEFVSCILFLVR